MGTPGPVRYQLCAGGSAAVHPAHGHQLAQPLLRQDDAGQPDPGNAGHAAAAPGPAARGAAVPARRRLRLQGSRPRHPQREGDAVQPVARAPDAGPLRRLLGEGVGGLLRDHRV